MLRAAALPSPPRRTSRTLAAGLALAMLTATAAGPVAAAEGSGAAPAAEEKKDKGPRRDQAGSLSGEFILLDPLFIPVIDEERGRTAIMGLVVRLQPNPDRRVDACYTIPQVVDALVIDFYETPLTRAQQTAKAHGPARKRVEEVVKRVAGPHVITGVSVFDQLPELDDTSAKLSRACK